MRRGAAARHQANRWAANHGEGGTALIELTWLGLLLLIPLVYVIITIVTVQRSAFGATEAVRAAGRAYILAPDVATAQQRAYRAAEIAMHDQGVELSPSQLVISCHPTPDSCLQPGSSVEVQLHMNVALPLAPAMGARSTASVAVSAAHVEPYGVYREAAPR
ncbi:MAG: hypothetical protein ACR2KG_08730 [Nocardioidaceae bacterium]